MCNITNIILLVSLVRWKIKGNKCKSCGQKVPYRPIWNDTYHTFNIFYWNEFNGKKTKYFC